MKDKSKILAIALVIITIVVLIVTFIINKLNKEESNNEIKIVTNYSNFYTVNSCLYRVVTYLSTNDKDSLMLVLTDKYKKQNKVTKENIMEYFDNVLDNSTFSSKKMYYENINDDITKYYVYGIIEDNYINDISSSTNKDSYFIVYLDTKNKIFEIEPYDGEIFLSGDKNEG